MTKLHSLDREQRRLKSRFRRSGVFGIEQLEPRLPLAAAIQITSIPSYGVDGFLQGHVTGVNPDDHRVAVYIYIEGLGWYTKPTFQNPTVAINSNGSFSADVATGGLDSRATILAAAVVPANVTPPSANGAGRIPASLAPLAIDFRERFGSTINFAGRNWGIKETPVNAAVGPGNNRFSDKPSDVFVDEEGLHLSVSFHDGAWWSTEVVLLDRLGYGTYTFQTTNRVDTLDPNVTFAGFTYDSYGDDDSIPAWPFREIDFEDSRWGNASDPTNSQVVVQPFTVAGNLQRYTLPDLSSDPTVTRFFDWSPEQIEFVTLRGDYDETNYPPEAIINEYVYRHDPPSGHLVPTVGRASFRFNVWINGGGAPTNGSRAEVVISDFAFSDLKFFDDTTLALLAKNIDLVEPAVPIYHNGALIDRRNHQVVEAFDRAAGTTNYPLTLVEQSANTFFRAAYQKPDGSRVNLGTSVVGSPSFRTSQGFQYIPQVRRHDVTTGGTERYKSVLKADFGTSAMVSSTRKFPDPIVGRTEVGLEVRVEALQPIELTTGATMSNGDRFRLMTLSSMFGSASQYDANALRYQDPTGAIKVLQLTSGTTRDAHLFPAAIELGSWFELVKQSGSTWFPDSPTIRVDILNKHNHRLGLQAFLASTTNPNDDSLTAWLELLDVPDIIPAGSQYAVDLLITALPPAGPKYNLAKPTDVTGDGSTAPEDALSIINHINTFGTTPIPENETRQPPYHDVDSDNFVAAGDALAVINYINTFGSDSEGENPSAVESLSDESSTTPRDALFALLAEQSELCFTIGRLKRSRP